MEDKVSPDSSSLSEAEYRNRDTPGKNDDFQKDLDEMLSGLLEKPNSGDLSHISDPEGNRSSPQPDVGGKVARQRLNFIVPRALVKRNERKNNARRRDFSKAPHHERLESKPLSAAAQQKLAFARDILPAGVRIGRNGRLEGTVLISETPSQIRENKARGRTGRAETLQKMTFAESLKQAAEVYLTNVNDKIEGLALTNQAGVTGDLGRIDIEFLDSDGSSLFHSVDIDETKIAEGKDKIRYRTILVAKAMAGLVGDENALTVLSSIVTQGLVTKIQSCLSNAAGVDCTSHLRPPGKVDRFNVLKDNGTREELNMVNFGVGRAKIKLTRLENNDFLLSVDWQTYFMRQVDHSNQPISGMALRDNDAFGVHFNTQITIDGESARRREIKIATDGVYATFSGCLDWTAG